MIDKRKIKIKNLLGIIDNPTHEDLLYEIALFLNDEQKTEFKKSDVNSKTKIRIGSSIEEDLQILIDKGYLSQTKTHYNLINLPY